jgi:hypothetical protein
MLDGLDRQGPGVGALAAPPQHDVVGEQRLERTDVALLGGGEEPARELVALRVRGIEAGLALLDMATPGPGNRHHRGCAETRGAPARRLPGVGRNSELRRTRVRRPP